MEMEKFFQNDKNAMGVILYIKESDIKSDNELLNKYKPLITPCKHSIHEIEDFLLDELSSKKISFLSLKSGFRQHIKYNINCHIETLGLDKSIINNEPYVYLIPKNEVTNKYYTDKYTPTPLIEGKDNICVVIEPNTEYIDCGSNRLFSEIILRFGITNEDYKLNTNRLFTYLACYREYINNYGI